MPTQSPYDQATPDTHADCWTDSEGAVWFDNGEPCQYPALHPVVTAEEDEALRALVRA